MPLWPEVKLLDDPMMLSFSARGLHVLQRQERYWKNRFHLHLLLNIPVGKPRLMLTCLNKNERPRGNDKDNDKTAEGRLQVKQGAINMTTMTNTETSRECRLRYE